MITDFQMTGFLLGTIEFDGACFRLATAFQNEFVDLTYDDPDNDVYACAIKRGVPFLASVRLSSNCYATKRLCSLEQFDKWCNIQ